MISPFFYITLLFTAAEAKAKSIEPDQPPSTYEEATGATNKNYSKIFKDSKGKRLAELGGIHALATAAHILRTPLVHVEPVRRTIILVRHGESEWNEFERKGATNIVFSNVGRKTSFIQAHRARYDGNEPNGLNDPLLTKEGIEQCRRNRNSFRDAIGTETTDENIAPFVSPYRRAIETARHITYGRDLKFRVIPSMGEVGMGPDGIQTITAEQLTQAETYKPQVPLDEVENAEELNAAESFYGKLNTSACVKELENGALSCFGKPLQTIIPPKELLPNRIAHVTNMLLPGGISPKGESSEAESSEAETMEAEEKLFKDLSPEKTVVVVGHSIYFQELLDTWLTPEQKAVLEEDTKPFWGKQRMRNAEVVKIQAQREATGGITVTEIERFYEIPCVTDHKLS